MADKWIETMGRDGVLCRISVATLARTYRRIRDNAQALASGRGERDTALRAIETDLRRLFADAKQHSAGVPLSDERFKQIGLTELPSWAKPED